MCGLPRSMEGYKEYAKKMMYLGLDFKMLEKVEIL